MFCVMSQNPAAGLGVPSIVQGTSWLRLKKVQNFSDNSQPVASSGQLVWIGHDVVKGIMVEFRGDQHEVAKDLLYPMPINSLQMPMRVT